ncbi:TSUP family transporter [Aneurinibacillus danicus]|uniref:TSUP family transporter n=1 Tax=Aneurinibacillus danicus TaxID=267746 RepID=UPI0011BF1D5F|nr:TSUP family transporter [Aneurinibacillus danicus]
MTRKQWESFLLSYSLFKVSVPIHAALATSPVAMAFIIPIALGGGIGYITGGFLDFMLLLQVLIGTMCGAYIGAKFTNFAPELCLR